MKSKLLIIATTLALLGTMVVGCAGPPPQAAFEASATSGQAPLMVTFTNLTETYTVQKADEFQWDFGDGATMTTSTTEEPVVHEYTKAGTHTVTLTAVKKGEPPQTSTATLTISVEPAGLETVTVPAIEVVAGETEQLEAMATDQYGNQVSEVDVTWTLTNEDAGSVTQAGLFEASEVAGAFGEVFEVKVTQEELVCTAVAPVTITLGPLEQVVIAPNTVEIGMEMTQQFVAVGADRYGNRILGLTFNWIVENSGGSIDETGLFIAGDTPGTYKNTVRAEATKGSITCSGTASVYVEPDRIAFISDRDQGPNEFDIYIMDVDGSNQERLTTTTGLKGGYYSFSPDGRRIAYWTEDHILIINDDGTWNIPLLSGREAREPAWSPDGTKIAFQSWEHVPPEIYVMDVDGGNFTRLTDNSAYDDYPAWSPDGTKIAFISDRDGTINNYCGRYASSIQPIYNAYFLTLFAQVIPQKVLLTSAPLENPGIVDISVAPEGTFIYAASKGREYTGYDTVRKQFPVDSEQAARLSQLNTKLTKLVQQPENRAFGLIGSALQLKFGQTTIARQDIAKSIPSTDSEAFLSTIKKLVKDLDPKKEYFRIEDTGLDIEILLTVQGDKNDTLRDFDKGDGVAYLNSDVPLNMKTGAALICGDTNSDVPMISAAQALTDDVTSIFVTTNQALKEKVLNIDPHAYFVSSPDVLITVLLGYALNQKQD